MEKQSALAKYRDHAGQTLDVLGKTFGIDKSTMLRWEEGRVPAERVLEVERVTGISRHELRPDIFGPAQSPAREASAA